MSRAAISLNQHAGKGLTREHINPPSLPHTHCIHTILSFMLAAVSFFPFLLPEGTPALLNLTSFALFPSKEPHLDKRGEVKQRQCIKHKISRGWT